MPPAALYQECSIDGCPPHKGRDLGQQIIAVALVGAPSSGTTTPLEYVRAVDDYAALLADDPTAFAGYYRWTPTITTAGDVLLPVGYVSTSQIPVDDYLATHPQ